MQDEMPGVAVAAPEAPAADGQPDFQDTVLALLAQMSDSIKGLSERVERVEQDNGSHILPRTLDDYNGPGERTRTALEAEPDGLPKSQKLPQFSTGESVPQMVMEQYAQRFHAGQRVRFRMDGVPHGRDDGKARGELKAEDGSPDGIGKVIDHVFLSPRTGKWKVRVKFPPRSLPGSNGGLTAVYEDELIPA